MYANRFKKAFLLVVLCCIGGLAIAQNRSVIIEEVIKIADVKTDSAIYTLSVSQKQISRSYLDGLGRPVQQVAVKGSPLQKDLIQFSVYDNLGRQAKAFLPYVGSTGTGAFRSSAITEQASFYGNGTSDKVADDTKPYSQQVFDTSPMQRLLQAGAVGNGFQPGEHYGTMEYRTNLSSETVRQWNADGSAATSYAAGTLAVTITTDQEGNQVALYQDSQGKTVLKKQWLGSTNWLETYYVYNIAGLLKYLVPPKAVAVMNTAGNYDLTQTAVDRLLFKYVYDHKGRQIERTVPGAGVAYMVYDPLDRLVLAQDANMRTANQWNYIKYNNRGVAISQGIYTDATYTTRSGMQSYVDGMGYSDYFEKRNSTSGTGYYSNVCFPTSNITPLAYSYYDDYDIDGNGTADYSYQAQSLTGEATATDRTRGLPTVVSKRTVGIGLSNSWLTSVMFYDKNGRTIQVQANNQLNSAVNNIQTIVPDFSGKTVRTKTVHIANSATTTVYSEMTYDHSDRLKTIDEKYNTGSFIRIAAYEYNELGQLVDRKLHSTNSGSTYLQSVDYRYNVQGQLMSINNSTLTSGGDDNDDSNDVFGMELLYHITDAGIGNTAYHNGQLSAVKWKTNSALSGANTNQRSYKFTFDRLMRLTDANYADRSGSGSWGATGNFDEKDISYDENGNILTLKRKAVLGGSATDVDDLAYSYSGNRLDNVTDGAGGSYASFGFRNLTGSTGAYSYDNNGNMASDPKKGLTLAYNILNRTDRITMTGHTGRYVDYTYDAGGTLIRKQAYDNSTLVKTTDYIGGFTYEDGTLAYFNMAEGRVRNAGGTFTNEYMIKDQQGNVRVSFEDNSGTAVVRQENSFYPYGLTMPGSALPTADNKRLYNGGSEWQNDFADLPDLQQTFYRNYDPSLGRFVGVDPIPESAESMTTYQYAMNNPVMMNDPMGDLYQNTGAGFWLPSHRIGPGSGNHWSDRLLSNSETQGPYQDFWDNMLSLTKGDGGRWSNERGFVSFNHSNGISATIIDPPSFLQRIFSFFKSQSPKGNDMDFTDYRRALLSSSKPGFRFGNYQIRGDNVDFLFGIGKFTSIFEEFRTGKGPENSVFLDNHHLTKMVKEIRAVEIFVTLVKEKLETWKSEGKDISKFSYTNYSGGFGLMGFISAGPDYAAQFIGSFSGDAFMSSNGNLIFVISDSKSRTSVGYRMLDEKGRQGIIRTPYGNTVQKYIWTDH